MHFKVEFAERLFNGKHIAVITIPKQPRPFAPKQDFGRLKRNVALVRRGSSTDEASISETSKMTLADAGWSRTARVDLCIETEKNDPFPAQLTLSFLRFGELPDHEEDNWMDMGNGFRQRLPSIRLVNRHYYRECAHYHAILHRLVLVRLSLANRSDFALTEVKLELMCSAPQGESIQLLRSDDLPDEPSSGDHLYAVSGLRTMAQQLRETVTVDDRAREPICHVLLGTLRPGETGMAETDIALLPTGAGVYILRVRTLAKEIATPIVKEHAVKIEGEIRNIELEDLKSLLFTERLGEAD